jgi:predicted transcriptional regulator
VRNFVFIERDDITREIKKNNPDSITDKFELQRFIQNNHKKGNYLKLKNKMIALENALSKRYNKPVDPVVYMISLYYKDNL